MRSKHKEKQEIGKGKLQNDIQCQEPIIDGLLSMHILLI